MHLAPPPSRHTWYANCLNYKRIKQPDIESRTKKSSSDAILLPMLSNTQTNESVVLHPTVPYLQAYSTAPSSHCSFLPLPSPFTYLPSSLSHIMAVIHNVVPAAIAIYINSNVVLTLKFSILSRQKHCLLHKI